MTAPAPITAHTAELIREMRAPTEVSPDGREIWDWADRLSDRVQIVDEIKRLRLQLHNARTTCGSCDMWMTKACPREVHDNRKGRSQGPSSMAIKCDRFSISRSSATSAIAAEEKIAELQRRLAPAA